MSATQPGILNAARPAGFLGPSDLPCLFYETDDIMEGAWSLALRLPCLLCWFPAVGSKHASLSICFLHPQSGSVLPSLLSWLAGDCIPLAALWLLSLSSLAPLPPLLKVSSRSPFPQSSSPLSQKLCPLHSSDTGLYTQLLKPDAERLTNAPTSCPCPGSSHGWSS